MRSWVGLLTVLALAGTLATAAPAATAGAAGTPPPANLVGRVTGPGSAGHTDTRFGLKATDLGIMWDNGAGQTLIAFGDSYGAGWTGPGGGAGDPATIDWRCQTLARSTDHRPADGLTVTDMVTDRPGHAAQLLPCRKDGNDAGGEVTVIPTAGISVGHRQYLSFMSVRHWGAAGHWDTNDAGIAVSDDNGGHWTAVPGARWPNPAGTDPFQMDAFARHGGYVYVYGTPNGRYGDVHLARVPENRLADPSAWRYWTGSAWRAGADTQAATLVTGPVGELSVRYDAAAHRWLMMYLIDNAGQIVLRQAASPTGPWGPPRVVVDKSAYPGLYGGFLWPHGTGRDLYFTMSQWDPYNVFLMHTTIG